MANRKRTKIQTLVNKILHRKLKEALATVFDQKIYVLEIGK